MAGRQGQLVLRFSLPVCQRVSHVIVTSLRLSKPSGMCHRPPASQRRGEVAQ
ncbi:hypothetical protein JOB18_037267, partial [Solea senegalensis]